LIGWAETLKRRKEGDLFQRLSMESHGALFMLTAAVMFTARRGKKLFALDNFDGWLTTAKARELLECMCSWVHGSDTQALLSSCKAYTTDNYAHNFTLQYVYRTDRCSHVQRLV
jgi:hypothetical protein